MAYATPICPTPAMRASAFILAVALFFAFADHTHAQPLSVDVQERVLDNGVTVLVWERPAAGRIGARTFYRVDVGAERPGTVGLTHMLEHYLFFGSPLVGTEDWETERPIAEAVERLQREVTDERNRLADCFRQRDVFAEVEADCSQARLDSLETLHLELAAEQNAMTTGIAFDLIYQRAGGTGLTASTGRDWMKFDIDLPANQLELFMWMERSRVENPVIRYFEPEREVVVDQIRRQDNRPDGPYQRVLRSLTYDAHPYGWAHWFSDLERATREDHWEIFYKYFIPQNLVIVVVGDVEAEEVFEQAEAYWGDWQMGRPSPRLRTVEPEPVGQKRLEVETAAGPAITWHVPMPAVGHDDAHVFDLMAEILGGTDGLLTQKLVDEEGLATSVSAAGWTSKFPSHFTLQVNTRSNDDLDAVEEALDEAMASLAANGVSETRIETAANRLVLGMAESLEQIGSSAVTIGSMESIYGWAHLNELPDRWAATSSADLARVAERYFAPEMRTVGRLKRTDTTAEADDSEAATPDEAYNRVRPGLWPAGGPVEEWFVNSLPRGPLSSKALGTKHQATDPHARPWEGYALPALDSLRDVRLDEPLAIGEQPWYAPPWMSTRRPAGFATPPPADHYENLFADPAELSFPDPAEHRITTDDGMQAFLIEDRLLPLVNLTVYIDAPVTRDPAGKDGLAELTAELLRRGGAGEYSSSEISDLLARYGASLSIDVDHNRTCLQLSGPPRAGDALIDLAGALVTAPQFNEEALASERDRLAIQAERAGDDATTTLRQLFHQTLYHEDHPLGRFPSASSVRSITHPDVMAFHAARYRPDRVTVALSGAFDAEETEAQLNQAFRFDTADSDLADAAEGATRTIEGRQTVSLNRDTRQGHVMLGHLGLDGKPENHAAIELMHYILAGGGFVSRMMEELRVQTGITSALFGELGPGRDITNPYLWRFSGNPETLAEGIDRALRQIERMAAEGVTEDEVEAARNGYLAGFIPASYDTPHKTAERLAYHQLTGRYAYQARQYMNYYAGDQEQVEALRAVTAEDVTEAARAMLDPDNLVIAVVGPIDEIRENADEDHARWVAPAE